MAAGRQISQMVRISPYVNHSIRSDGSCSATEKIAVTNTAIFSVALQLVRRYNEIVYNIANL